MKKGWKLFWITSGVVACIGLILLIVGVGMGASYDKFLIKYPFGIGGIGYESGYSYGYGETAQDVDINETFQNITELDLDVSLISVQILKSDNPDNQIRMEVKDIDPRLRFQYEVEDGTLNIETDSMKKTWRFRDLSSRGTVWLYVPDNMLEEVSLQIGVGEMYVEDLNTNYFYMDAGVGESVIDNFTANNVEFHCGVGDITAIGTPKETAIANCGIGSIDFTINGKESDFSYYVDCGIGEVSIGDSAYSGLGSTKEINNNSEKTVEVDCGIGEVSILFTE